MGPRAPNDLYTERCLAPVCKATRPRFLKTSLDSMFKPPHSNIAQTASERNRHQVMVIVEENDSSIANFGSFYSGMGYALRASRRA